MSEKVITKETRKAYFKLFPGFILCLILLVGCANGKKEQIDFGNQHLVRIECEDRSGSGVVYDVLEECVILVTAAHVVEETEEATVIWEISEEKKSSGQYSKTCSASIAEIIRVPGLDLAFLKVQAAAADGAILKNMQKVPDSELALWGYNGAGEVLEVSGMVSESWIYVEEFGCHMLIAKAETVPGMSGGGAYDSNGKFAGIICGADENGNVAILSATVIAYEYGNIFGQ